MIQINPLKSYIDGGVRAALTTPPSASLVFDLPGKAIWVKGVKLKGTDHTYTFNHDNYITLTNTPDKNNPESEDIKIGVNITTLKNVIDTTYNGGTLALLQEGLNTEERTWQAKILHSYINNVLPTTKNLQINGTNYAIYTTANSLPQFFAPTSLGTTGQILACTSSGLSWINQIQNTDYRVSQSSATSNSDYRIILKQGANNNPETDFVRFSEYLTFNPYTKTLKINNIKVVTATDIYVGSNAGLVPTATSAQQNYYLRGDGAWVNIATEMAAANTWRPIKVGNTDALGSGTNTGTLSFIAGTGITLSWDATNKRIIITNSSPDINHNTDETVRQVPKTDNVNRPLMMINGSTSAGEQINTSMFSTGIYANASTKMITANGFIKAGSSDNYVLLGGGNHKALSDFSMSGHNHDGRYLRWNGSAADISAMGWGTLTTANGYTILSHASSSDGGDVGFTSKNGQIFMQLDGYYYQNEGRYRVLDTTDFTAFSNIGNQTTRITIGGITKDLKIDADTLDNRHATYFWNYKTPSKSSGDLDVNEVLGDTIAAWAYGFAESTSVIHGPIGDKVSDARAYYTLGGVYCPLQLSWYYTNSASLYARTYYNGKWYSWNKIAFISDIPTVTDYYWANVKISSSSSTSTSPTFSTCYTSNWFRSTGQTGWYSENYGGGINMTDSTWVRIYNNKKFYVNNSEYNAIHSAGGVYVAGMVHSYANYLKSTKNEKYVMIGPQNSSHAHYETDATVSHWFNKRVDVNGAIWRYNTNYGIDSDGYFYAKGIYANRDGSSTGGGVSLYTNTDPMVYGIAFRGTGTYGTHGYVTSAGDWATYLTMNDSTTRGWIFRRGNTNVASIAGSGNMAIGQHLEFSNGAHISTNRSTDYHYGYTFNLSSNTQSIGMYSGPAGEAGGVVISPDGCLIYNSSDCGYNLQVRDKDLGTDLTATATLTFGIEQSGYYAWSRGGFKKNGSSDSYVLLGGGGHKAVSDFATSGHTHSSITIPVCSSLDENSHVFRIEYAGGSNSVATKPSGVDAFGVIRLRIAEGWYGQIMMSANTAPGIYYRNADGLSSSVGWKKLLDSSNFNSYSPKLDGTGASGTWNISVSGNAATATSAVTSNRTKFIETFKQGSTTDTYGSSYPIWAQWSNSTNVRLKCTNYTVWTDKADYASSAGNADTVDGLHIHSGRNNEANKIVRTDANGYIQAGWINTLSGDMGTTAATRIYCSDDCYIRYKTPANFFSTLTNDSNQLSITVGSQNRKLTVNYANSAGTATLASFLRGPDKRSDNEPPKYYMSKMGYQAGLCTEFSTQGSSLIGVSGYTLLLTAEPWGDSSGGNPMQIALGPYGMALRTPNGSSAWNGWPSGNIYAGNFYTASDIRFKKIINYLEVSVDSLSQIPIFNFKWIDSNDILEHSGTSAQEVEKILPNIVTKSERLTVDYATLGTIAGITACKELVTQKSEIEQLKEKVKQLEDKLSKYENTL